MWRQKDSVTLDTTMRFKQAHLIITFTTDFSIFSRFTDAVSSELLNTFLSHIKDDLKTKQDNWEAL